MSVTVPSGFVAAGGSAGVKPSGPDVALVATATGRPVAAAGVFTTNRAAAPPVLLCRRHLAQTGNMAAAIVLNSGNANAATGSQGMSDAQRMCAAAAGALGSLPAEVLVCSTGLIGIPLPVAALEAAIPALVGAASPDRDAALAAALAIMTTDTRPKEVTVRADRFVVGGMAKGAAMLSPSLATMLAVLTTDADVRPAALQRSLHGAVERSFNSLTIDGCSSTNDTVLVMASGAGPAPPEAELTEALSEACAELAGLMAADAEGGTKVAQVVVEGAYSDEEACRAARKVADSLLVKCSLHGGDPYWGRVVSELGSAGVGFDMERVSVSYGGIEVCCGGVAVDHDEAAVLAHMGADRLEIGCDLGIGRGRGSMLMTDLGHGYIDENVGTS